MTRTTIEWTDEVWNPVTGCRKVSHGCKHCYAERVFSRPYPGRAFTDVQTHPERLDAPLRWRKPRRVFVNSMSDLFHEFVPDAFIDQIFAVMALAPQHTFQVLTKRVQRMNVYMTYWPNGMGRVHHVRSAVHRLLLGDRRDWSSDDPAWNRAMAATAVWPLPNVWLGVSVEDQETADYRIPLLLQTPAAVRWISAEPLLAPVDLGKWLWACCGNTTTGAEYMGQREEVCCNQPEPRDLLDRLDAGGESGPHARPTHPAWLHSLRDQCLAAGVPFFFKQWGEWLPISQQAESFTDGLYRANRVANPDQDQCDLDESFGRRCTVQRSVIHHDGSQHDIAAPGAFDHRSGAMTTYRVGKKAAGRLLDGREHLEYPHAHI